MTASELFDVGDYIVGEIIQLQQAGLDPWPTMRLRYGIGDLTHIQEIRSDGSTWAIYLICYVN